MVQITRTHPRGATRAVGGSKSKASKGSSIMGSVFTVRNILVLLAVLQGVRVLLSGTDDAVQHQSPLQAALVAPPPPLGLHDRLKDSVVSSKGRGGAGVRGSKPKEPETAPYFHDPIDGDSGDGEKEGTALPDAEKENDNAAGTDDIGADAHSDDHAGQNDGGDNSNSNNNNEGTDDAPHEKGDDDTAADGAADSGRDSDSEKEAEDSDSEKEDEKENDTDDGDNDGDKKNAGTPGGGLNPIVVKKKGTGPTSVGYIKAFDQERKHPAYRTVEIPDAAAEAVRQAPAVAKLVNEESVMPCQTSAWDTDPKCSDSDTPLIAYNSESFPRIWCGQTIQPRSAVVLTEHCTDPIAHLFPVDSVPVTGEHMPPIVIKSEASKDKTLLDADVKTVECDIPCRMEIGHKLNDKTNSFFDNEDWTMTTIFNEHQNVKLDRTDYQNDKYYSSYSLWSSVPISTFDSSKHTNRNTRAVDFHDAKNKAIYLVDTMCSAADTKRNRWFEAVQEQMTVDSYGRCGHNAEVPKGSTIATAEGRIELMKQYRIVLALDDSKSKDHISDVVWEALASGAVPVVVGAENLDERLPPKSFINVNHFNKYADLGPHVKKVIEDQEVWESYQKWREDETAIAKFEEQYAFAVASPTCRMCRWAYAKKYGLGWDHHGQKVRSIPRVPKDKFCVTADHGLVSKPFSEQWVYGHKDDGAKAILEEDSDGESCSSLETDGQISVGAFKFHRQVLQHDGVTDFVIGESEAGGDDDNLDSGLLRLKFPGVRNPEGAVFYHTHTLVSTAKGARISSATIQDEVVKVTILADWDTRITSSGEGIMEIPLASTANASTRRVRVIIEELNKVYDKMTEFYPSSYGRMMINDFLNPLGVYFVHS